jgi:hypothetical protein
MRTNYRLFIIGDVDWLDLFDLFDDWPADEMERFGIDLYDLDAASDMIATLIAI